MSEELMLNDGTTVIVGSAVRCGAEGVVTVTGWDPGVPRYGSVYVLCSDGVECAAGLGQLESVDTSGREG